MILYEDDPNDKGQFLHDQDAREKAQYLKLRQGTRTLLQHAEVPSNPGVGDYWIVSMLRSKLELTSVESWDEESDEAFTLFQSQLLQILSDLGQDTTKIPITRAEALMFDTLEQRRILGMLSTVIMTTKESATKGEAEAFTEIETALLTFLKTQINSAADRVDMYFEGKSLRQKVSGVSGHNDQELLSALAKIKAELDQTSLIVTSGYLHPYDGGGIFIKITSK